MLNKGDWSFEKTLERIELNKEGQTREEVMRKRQKRTTVTMSVVAALLIFGLVFVGVNLHDQRSSGKVTAEYEAAYDAYLASVDKLDESLVSVAGTINSCRDSVADQTVCEELERLNAQGLELSNSRLRKSDIYTRTNSELRDDITELQEKQGAIDQLRETLLAALEPIAQSQVDKIKLSIDTAVVDAERVLGQAQKIVDGVHGDVVDVETIDNARAAIAALRSQIEGAKAVKGTDTAAYTAALDSLKETTEAVRSAANAVIYSHQQWVQENPDVAEGNSGDE